MAAESEQSRLIALDERLERAVMPTPDQGDEPLIGLKPKQRRTPCKRRKSRGVL
jgi:hypothetical protein